MVSAGDALETSFSDQVFSLCVCWKVCHFWWLIVYPDTGGWWIGYIITRIFILTILCDLFNVLSLIISEYMNREQLDGFISQNPDLGLSEQAREPHSPSRWHRNIQLNLEMAAHEPWLREPLWPWCLIVSQEMEYLYIRRRRLSIDRVSARPLKCKWPKISFSLVVRTWFSFNLALESA